MSRARAFVLGAMIFAAGCWFGGRIDDFLDQDACLDHGGAWLGWYCVFDRDVARRLATP